MDALELEELVRQFVAGPLMFRTAWGNVPAGARQWRPGPGKWSAHEVLGHCADAAAVGHARLRYLLVEDDPVIVGWNQDAWTKALDYHAQPAERALAVIDATYANTLPLLRRLTPEAMRRPGRHTEFGAITVESYLRSYADHLHVHVRQIHRNVAAFRDQAKVG